MRGWRLLDKMQFNTASRYEASLYLQLLRCWTTWHSVTAATWLKLQLNEGLGVIGDYAFQKCRALRNVTIPSSVAGLGCCAFHGCRELSEVILLSGERFLSQEFLNLDLVGKKVGLLNQESLEDFLFDEDLNEERYFAFHDCPLNKVKVYMSHALSERMERLPQDCRRSVEERIRDMDRLEVMQDGNALACFPVVRSNDTVNVQDANDATARSLNRAFMWIAFHELKESSILIELVMWKSKIDSSLSDGLPREDCRVAIPGPAKTAIMEYCGFAGILKPASDCV
mmetsp:Transcript_2917/g.6509  ORF Transcript_2917/g.6509 Transcript_2917/m.6509 type:complete len:284 (-) Transcript_2917:135-986(-)